MYSKCPACEKREKHEVKKQHTLIFKIISPLIRNWCIQNYAYIRDLKSITNSALQLNQTVRIQMKTRILHTNEAESTFLE